MTFKTEYTPLHLPIFYSYTFSRYEDAIKVMKKVAEGNGKTILKEMLEYKGEILIKLFIDVKIKMVEKGEDLLMFWLFLRQRKRRNQR